MPPMPAAAPRFAECRQSRNDAALTEMKPGSLAARRLRAPVQCRVPSGAWGPTSLVWPWVARFDTGVVPCRRLRGWHLRAATPQSEDAAPCEHVPKWGLPTELKKMKVALHIGYDGSQYRGLQINRENAVGQTVEHFIEQAVFQVGGIRPSNMGEQN